MRGGHRAAGLRDADARADGGPFRIPVAAPDDVEDAHYGRAHLGAHFGKRVARAVRPAEPAADAPAFLQAHGGAHTAADEPRAFINAVPHTDGATHGDADASTHSGADACARSGADAAADACTVFGTVVKPVAAAYYRSHIITCARTYISTVAPAVVSARPGADVRPHCSTVRRTHLKALSATVGAPDDRSTHHVESDGRADEPPFRTTVLTPRTRAHAQADGVADAHGRPDAAGPLLRLHQNRDGPAPLLFNRGRHLRPEHGSDL